jgi:hypothetical protein
MEDLMIKKRNALALLLGAFAMIACSFVSCKMNSDDDGGSSGSSTGYAIAITVPEASFTGYYSPATSATGVYEDGSLMIKFDAAPTISSTSSAATASSPAVKIYSSGGTLVDTIYATNETISSIVSKVKTDINVHDQLITLNGKTVTIKPHKMLSASTEYYVLIDNGLFTGKQNGVDFAGITDTTAWRFTTRAAPSITTGTITVGADKNFSTVQAAFEYLTTNASTGDWTVSVDAGYYHERLGYYGSANVTLVGPSTYAYAGATTPNEDTFIYWSNMNGTTSDVWNASSRGRCAFLWEGGNLTLKNLTFVNTINREIEGKDGTQAETLYFDSTAYLVANNCSFKSHQDTLLLGNNGGRCWFYKDYIEGDTDYIWGYADVALFEECSLRCLYDSSSTVTTHTSYIFASRTLQGDNANKGFVLLNSNITVEDGVTAYYGRNSGSDTQATVVYNTFNTIDSALWGGAAGKYDEDIEGICSVGFKDYGNTYTNGSTISQASRVADTYSLSKVVAEREYIGRRAVLNRGWDATNRVYVPTTTQWDFSAYETEFSASKDKSLSVVYLTPTYISYLAGGKSSSAFTAADYKGTAVTVTDWAVDNTTAASVAGGVVTAAADQVATVTLTATTADGTGVATVNIIKAIVPATGATLAWVDTTITSNTIEVGDTKSVTLAYTPDALTDNTTEWTSSDTNVVRVTGSGALGDGTSASVYGFGAGTATITATNKATNSVFATLSVTVKDVYYASYLNEGTYTKVASVAHRDATIAASPVSYGFAGNVTAADPSSILWGNSGWPFASSATVSNSAGGDFAWADFSIKAAGDISIKAISADLYCSVTSKERAIAYISTDGGTTFTKVAEAQADNKLMSFAKQSIAATTVASGSTAIVRLAIASTDGNTVSKMITGVIGSVKIYYDITGTPVAFAGADGSYNITDYVAAADQASQWHTVTDGSTADGMISWTNLVWHSTNYGVAVSGSANTGYVNIKVGGPSVISIVGSQYSNGTLTVTNAAGTTLINAVSTKMSSDSSIATRTLSFLYTDATADTLKLAFTGTSYIGTITVKELTTEKATVDSVVVNGSSTVSTASPSTFTATVTATYCADKSVTWTSSDTSVATVSSAGKVTGLKAGTATITATSVFDTTKSGTYDITVIEEVPSPVVGTTYTYDFKSGTTVLTAATAGSSSDTFCSWNNLWTTHSYGIVNNTAAGATISLSVAGNVLIGFTGYSAASGTMRVTDTAGNEILASLPMRTGNDATTIWFIYKGAATTITLTSLTKNCYISTLTVKPWTNEVPAVTAVAVAGSSTIYTDNGTATYTATVTGDYFPGTGVTWTVTDTSGAATSLATIDSSTGVLTMSAAGTVKVTATSTYTTSVSGSKTVTIVAGSPAFADGKTYDYNFLGTDMATYSAATTGGTFGYLTAVITGGWQGSGYGYSVKTNDTFTASVTGSAQVTISESYKGSGYTITTNGTGTLSASQTGSFSAAGDFTVTYLASSATEKATITFTSVAQSYCDDVKIVSIPTSGATYDYNFLGTDMATYSAATTGGTFGFLTAVITGGWQGSGYGYNVKTNDTFTVVVTGNATVGITSSYNANAYTVTTTGTGTLSASTVTSTGTGTITYTAASSTEVCTIIFKSTGQNYCSHVVIN